MALQVEDFPVEVLNKGGKTAYDTIFAKSFSQYEQKKFGYGALIGCFIITFSFFTILKPQLSSLPILNLRHSMNTVLPMQVKEDRSNSQHQMTTTKMSVLKGIAERKVKQEIIKPICNLLDPRSDSCEVKGEIRIHGNSSTIFAVSSQINSLEGNGSWAIRPYARKGDNIAMSHVKELSVKTLGGEGVPHCTVNYSVPAIVFSIGGYAGNYFHDFTDVLIPLFVTSYQFNREVQFLITDLRSYWIDKYQTILKQLSRFDVIDIDKDHDTVRCFPHMILGLKASKEFSIDPSKSPNGYSMTDFGQFLKRAYSLKKATAIKISDHINRKPRLLIISRKKTRSLANEGEIDEMARSLGYEVVVEEARSDVSMFAPVVNSFDVLMGVHGAGLTNLVFLPANAIVIQIVPLGLDWLSMDDFGKPVLDLNLRYLEYKVKKEESSLIQQYPLDHAVFGDSDSIWKQGWLHFRSIYLDKQDVKLDVGRFRSTLLEALELLHH
ncbi:alpha-1,3-arabinosyltransferase XAT2-like [Telopea speciosissima]|uniref:alpha-1,3-arabinosyltransferase XAT2-like n=1 Tax=Telopea speciosissima TaxID=54955 RepID=UPI001CC65E2A|nr:alpha-1,3-arabinosyltransferase XAT2-like [Telopea speciosissima]